MRDPVFTNIHPRVVQEMSTSRLRRRPRGRLQYCTHTGKLLSALSRKSFYWNDTERRHLSSNNQDNETKKTKFRRPSLIDRDDLDSSQESSAIQKTTEELIEEYSSLPQTHASLQMLMRTGRGEQIIADGDASPAAGSFKFNKPSYKTEAFMGRMGQRLATERILIHLASLLRKEIPIRLAHRIKDLEKVPLMKDMPSVKQVKAIYKNSFELLVHSPPINNIYDEEEFARTLKDLYTRHAGVLVQMARGAYELREAARTGQIEGIDASLTQQQADSEFAKLNECHAFLDRFYMSRIGIRVLAGQYLELREEPKGPNYIGMVCLETSPFEIVRTAAENAKGMCRTSYGRTPLVQISGRLDLTLPYIPTYLHYVVLELLKNALRATCERHGAASKSGARPGPLPPVQVIIADGTENEDVVIKIADEGGGIPRSQIHKIWSYLYTTADPAVQEGFIGKSGAADHDVSHTSPIAGLGYGLPISRSYCRYFGGAMDLVSMEGYGTDAFIHLKRLDIESSEPGSSAPVSLVDKRIAV